MLNKQLDALKGQAAKVVAKLPKSSKLLRSQTRTLQAAKLCAESKAFRELQTLVISSSFWHKGILWGIRWGTLWKASFDLKIPWGQAVWETALPLCSCSHKALWASIKSLVPWMAKSLPRQVKQVETMTKVNARWIQGEFIDVNSTVTKAWLLFFGVSDSKLLLECKAVGSAPVLWVWKS